MLIYSGFNILKTEEWGAAPPKDQPVVRPYSGGGVVFHHMDWDNRPLLTDTKSIHDKAIEVAKRCQQDHFHNGWIDTGQHFTVTREGIILEGRHGSIAAVLNKHEIVMGAHAADPDHHVNCNDWWGIENEGTYISEPMPKEQFQAMTNLMAWLCFQQSIDTTQIIGHRATGCSTACPGDWLYAQTKNIQSIAHVKKLILGKRK